MPRPATGTIIEQRNATGGTSRTLRFSVNGRKRKVALGQVTRAEAEERLQHELADVARGTWKPPSVVERSSQVDLPTFHAYAETWWTLNASQLSENTRADYRWRLEKHLLGYFGETPLDQIKAATVEVYIADKLTVLSPRSVNMTVILLGAILKRAVQHELIVRNPAQGCRARERAPVRSYLESAWQLQALLDAAGELDRDAAKNRRHVARRAMLAVLVFAGLRISELCALRWRDVDLADGWLHVGSKTEAGHRKVKIRGALRDELLALRAGRDSINQGVYVFATARGGKMSDDNFRSRVLGRPGVVENGERVKLPKGAVGLACARLEDSGSPPLPKLTPNSLRRTFASILYALGEDPGTVMDEMGHTDPALALRVYRQAMRRDQDEKAALRTLVEGGFRPSMDPNSALRGSEGVAAG